MTTGTASTGNAAECGNGLVEEGEECDEGTDNADDAACTANCQEAECGDGLIQKDVEVCDDSVNDGKHGGCNMGCMELAPYCGDDSKNGPEECDGDDACLPGVCTYARSCLDYKTADPQSASGKYLIRRDKVPQPIEVWCEMDDAVDGGGYTFLKIDVDSDVNDTPAFAKNAEVVCGTYGMKLFIPRSQNHLKSAYDVATKENIKPLGGGTVPLNSDYLRIMGIYPKEPSKSCVDKAINNVECLEWVASDAKVYWVSSVSVVMGEPDPDGACSGCSMSYTWNLDGTVKKYSTVVDFGGASLRFMCDTGDKLPK